MGKTQITVDGVLLDVESGTTILESIATQNVPKTGLYIPTLYYLKGVNDVDESGICVVEVEVEEGLVNASSYPVSHGMSWRLH